MRSFSVEEGQSISSEASLWRSRFSEVRATSEQLCAPLSPEDSTIQSMPDVSPPKWHLAHTTWFFETFFLSRFVDGYRPFHPQYKVLFNSYYEGVGEFFPRTKRGLLSRPGLAEILKYRRAIDEALTNYLDNSTELSEAERTILETGLHHEQQHQELLLMDIKHIYFTNPLRPKYRAEAAVGSSTAPALRWKNYDGGIAEIGHGANHFSFDNERPRHRVFLNAYQLASRLVTNGEFLSFINDGGYSRPEFWLSAGWDFVKRESIHAPLYWELTDGEWHITSLAGTHRLDLNEPVCHVSYFEADAYARWLGKRIPTEAEWENAAAGLSPEGNFLESGLLRPSPAAGPQFFGDVWEWTSSSYGPYPGFRPSPGNLGEYNGKFMCNQYVLRGGACVTPQSHIRSTYRNFFPPESRWQFSGIRLANDHEVPREE